MQFTSLEQVEQFRADYAQQIAQQIDRAVFNGAEYAEFWGTKEGAFIVSFDDQDNEISRAAFKTTFTATSSSKETRMTTYIITELQNANSSRKGATVEATNLSAAKRKANRKQMFHGTVMEIAYENGAVVSVKESGGWQDR